MKTLTIRLAGPLQSYGNEASFERRTTGDYPSKSAVIGMLAAALGYQRNDSRILRLNQLDFAVRIDQVGEHLKDFQTVEWKQGSRKITYRDYLQDALFMVGIGSEDEEVVEQLKMALAAPRFQLFLGRRANVPAGILQTNIYVNKNPITVLESLNWQAAEWYQQRDYVQNVYRTQVPIEIVADAQLLSKDGVMVKDLVGSFDERNRYFSYRARASERIYLQNLYHSKDGRETNQDPLNFL